MNDYTELIAKLREAGDIDRSHTDGSGPLTFCHEAADLIESLTTPTPDEGEALAIAWDEGMKAVGTAFLRPLGENGTREVEPNPYRAAGYRKVPTEANHGHDTLVNGCERCDRYGDTLIAQDVPTEVTDTEREEVMTGQIVTASFEDGTPWSCGLEDCECPEHDDQARPVGTYLTIRLDADPSDGVGFWRVEIHRKAVK